MLTARQLEMKRWNVRRAEVMQYLAKYLPPDLSDDAVWEINQKMMATAKKLGIYKVGIDADDIIESAWERCELAIRQIIAVDRRARLLPKQAEGGKSWTRM